MRQIVFTEESTARFEALRIDYRSPLSSNVFLCWKALDGLTLYAELNYMQSSSKQNTCNWQNRFSSYIVKLHLIIDWQKIFFAVLLNIIYSTENNGMHHRVYVRPTDTVLYLKQLLLNIERKSFTVVT